MEWYLALLIIFGSLIIMMATGLPVAFCFLVLIIGGALILWGGTQGLQQLTLSIYRSLSTFSLMPLPLFILMGEILFQSGIGPTMIDALDKWLGRLPGRLGLLAVGAGALLSTLTGSSIGSTVLLGSTVVPEMERRGYKKPMSLGPILGSGGLAIMIPPSAMAVVLGAIGEISIGGLLIAIIIPGLCMAILYATYIITRCKLQPSLAPAYDTTPTPLLEKLSSSVINVLPIGIVIFLVTGVIFMGIATPSEAAATGVIGSLILAAIHRKLGWGILKTATLRTIGVTVMVFMTAATAKAYSSLLAFTGASQGLAQFAIDLPVAPIVIILAIQVVGIILGMFLGPGAIVFVAVPIFMPVVLSLDFDPLWFGAIFLLNMEMATTSPPFGLSLFAMKGVAPPDTTMGDVYKAALPFLGCDAIVMLAMVFFPSLALWLPGLMR